MKYHTFKKNVKLLPGQVVHFLKGRGYFAYGKPRPIPAPKPVPVAQPIIMYDTVSPSLIPANARVVAGYVNGYWPTYAHLTQSFPHAKHLSIAVNTSHDADVLDVESGDATPAEAPAWVRRQHARGKKRPVVYTFLAQAQTLVNTLSRAGIPRDSYLLWTAHWTDRPHFCNSSCGLGFTDHADATQYTDHALGRNLDASVVSPRVFA